MVQKSNNGDGVSNCVPWSGWGKNVETVCLVMVVAGKLSLACKRACTSTSSFSSSSLSSTCSCRRSVIVSHSPTLSPSLHSPMVLWAMTTLAFAKVYLWIWQWRDVFVVIHNNPTDAWKLWGWSSCFWHTYLQQHTHTYIHANQPHNNVHHKVMESTYIQDMSRTYTCTVCT